MRNRELCIYLSFVLLASCLGGCELEGISDRGATCPPANVQENLKLSYILEKDGTKCDMASCPEYLFDFQNGTCPRKLPTCALDSDGEYYCLRECETPFVACSGMCEDPRSSRKFCGARGGCFDADESSENYMGKACADDEFCENGSCIKDVCSGVVCDSVCITPETSAEHCGAKGMCHSDDVTSDNYRGDVCKLDQNCIDGKCVCREGLVECNDKCIDPENDEEYCGARGLCSERAPEHPNYMGDYCETTEICREGKCVLSHCETLDERLCTNPNGSTECRNVMQDVVNCGGCDTQCSAQGHPNAEVDRCENGICMYRCTGESENCGNEKQPVCYTKADMAFNAHHCGACNNACKSDEKCDEGKCVPAKCGDLCEFDGQCVSDNEHCGAQCSNCNELKSPAASGRCLENTCVVTTCVEGFHLIQNDDGTIGCARNTDTECAPVDSLNTVNCKIEIQDGDSKCNQDGTCERLSCYGNQCQSGQQCINTDTQCGSGCLNCTNYNHATSGACEAGECKALSCASGYHLYGNVCEKDDDEHCGDHDTNCSAEGKVCKNRKCYVPKGACTRNTQPDLCIRDDGGDGICHNMAYKNDNNDIRCMSEDDVDENCFYDDSYISCPRFEYRGLTGKCVYQPEIQANKEDWNCECEKTGKYYKLNSENKYECQYL